MIREDDLDFERDYDDYCVCDRCDGRGEIFTCIDDICHGLGDCIHGDGWKTCPKCGGEGEWLDGEGPFDRKPA